jgi:hypothetical protein
MRIIDVEEKAEPKFLAPEDQLLERQSAMCTFDGVFAAHQEAAKKESGLSHVLSLHAPAGLGITNCLSEMTSRASSQGANVFLVAGNSLERHRVWGGAGFLLLQVFT